MKKITFTFIILGISLCSCKKNTTKTDPVVNHEIDAKVSQFSCADFYYYYVNQSTASSTEVDFGDGSPNLVLSSNVGYHQYTNSGNFNFRIKQTFSNGQVVEKTFPINITQLCKFKRILSTDIPRSVFWDSSGELEAFEFGGNVYFGRNGYPSAYNKVYNIASNRFFSTPNHGNGVSSIYDGTYFYNITGSSSFIDIKKHTFDSIDGGGNSSSISSNIPKRYKNLEIVVNGKLYYGFGESSVQNAAPVKDSKLYSIDCATGVATIIPTPFGTNSSIYVGGQAFYNNKIYIFSSGRVIIFDPATNNFTSLLMTTMSLGPGFSNKTKVINNYAFMKGDNESILVYDFNTNTFLNNCELSNMYGVNFVANNKYCTLNPIYYNNPYVFPNSELWEYQP